MQMMQASMMLQPTSVRSKLTHRQLPRLLILDVSAANDAYLRLSQTVGNTERYIRDNVDEQGRFNQEISAGTQQANDILQKKTESEGTTCPCICHAGRTADCIS